MPIKDLTGRPRPSPEERARIEALHHRMGIPYRRWRRGDGEAPVPVPPDRPRPSPPGGATVDPAD